MIRNMMRASALDLEFFNRAERSSDMTVQAFTVVVIANALAAVGSWIGYENTAGEKVWENLEAEIMGVIKH